jgi:hypothetical protein
MKKSVVCRLSSVVLFLAALAGCASYRWTSSVPEELRTVAVPVFENRTSSAELGPIVSQYVLREFQREGTFAIRRAGDSSLEVQGVIVKASRDPAAFNRGYGSRASEYRYTVTAEVSLINKDTGKVLLNNRRYVAETTFLTRGDLLTTQRDAAARIAQEFARQIVDDVTAFDYNRQGK